ESREVFIHNRLIELTGKEFSLLSKLASSPMRVFTRELLLDHIWENYESRDLRLVDTHIKNIRMKLKQIEKNMKFIQTVWGVGYKMSSKEGG
ncbi:winged helix-turn-helix domain-containing protein, partial [Mycobacterium tuberculosis]